MKKIVYAVLAVFSFILFYELIPLDVYDNFFYFLVIIGGLITTVCLGAFMFSFPSVRHPENESNFGCVVVPALIGFFIGVCILFIFHEASREEDELLKYGVFTEATVADGSSISSRKADFTHLTLEFTTAKGEKFATDYSISKTEFQNYYQFQKIPVLYSTRYPMILKILRSERDIREYMEKKSRMK